MPLTALPLLFSGVLLLVTTTFLRYLYIHPVSSQWRARSILPKTGPSHMVVVLGSGGHTREMIGLLRGIDPKKYVHRTYIASAGDDFAKDKAREIEANIQFTGEIKGKEPLDDFEPSAEGVLDIDTGRWDFVVVPRARKIHQSILTTPISALQSLFACILVLRKAAMLSAVGLYEYPDVVITNGPATAVMVILASIILRFLGIAPAWKMKVIYVESWARVKSLSLSGRILLSLGVCDIFIVQWKKLADQINTKGKSRKVVHMDCLVK